jgi:uncharacterized protein YkwD
MPNASDLEGVRAAVFCLINRERARRDEIPLRADRRLRLAAQKHSDDMVSHGYFNHGGPDGETLLQRLQGSDYLYSPRIGYEVGENIAWGTLTLATPHAIVQAWMDSPEHRANILNPSFRDTGIGLLAQAPAALGADQAGATYTQDFGVIWPT